MTLTPAGSWDIEGGHDPATSTYRLDLFGPSGNVTRRVPGAAVVHGRYSVDPARPWFGGISPMGWATLSGKLHAATEDALADEAGGTRGHLLPVPQGPDGDDDDDPHADLRGDIQALRGRTVMVETTAAGWGEGMAAAPRADWKPQRLGAAPGAPVGRRPRGPCSALVACQRACSRRAAMLPESWRLFLHGAVQPVADLLAVELAAKLDAPRVAAGVREAVCFRPTGPGEGVPESHRRRHGSRARRRAGGAGVGLAGLRPGRVHGQGTARLFATQA